MSWFLGGLIAYKSASVSNLGNVWSLKQTEDVTSGSVLLLLRSEHLLRALAGFNTTLTPQGWM